MKKVEKKVKKVGGGGEWNKLTRPIGVPSPSSRVERGTTELRKEVYEESYEDFFEWCSRDRQYPKMFLEEYAEVESLRKRVNSDIVSSALGHALREMRKEQFGRISFFIKEVVGERKDSPDTPSYFSGHGQLDVQGNLSIDLFAGLRRRVGASSKTSSAPTGELPRKHGMTDKDALGVPSGTSHTGGRGEGASLPRSQGGTEEGVVQGERA